jgi:hypothetical protein
MAVQEGNEVLTRYRLRGSPGAVRIDSGGRIASSAATGSYALRELLADTARARANRTLTPGR